jgi:hypothetical protein
MSSEEVLLRDSHQLVINLKKGRASANLRCHPGLTTLSDMKGNFLQFAYFLGSGKNIS